MAYWIQFKYDRNTYIIDLESVGAFIRESQTKRFSFCLPYQSQQIILSPLTDSDAYKEILNFLNKAGDREVKGFWIALNYDRSEFFIDLYRIKTFIIDPVGRIKFYLPDTAKEIIINQQTYPDVYQNLLDFIEKNTGIRST